MKYCPICTNVLYFSMAISDTLSKFECKCGAARTFYRNRKIYTEKLNFKDIYYTYHADEQLLSWGKYPGANKEKFNVALDFDNENILNKITTLITFQ